MKKLRILAVLTTVTLGLSASAVLAQNGGGGGGTGGDPAGDPINDQLKERDRLEECDPDNGNRVRNRNLPEEVQKALKEMKQKASEYKAKKAEMVKQMAGATDEEREALREQLREMVQEQAQVREQLRERLQELRQNLETHEQLMEQVQEQVQERRRGGE